MCRGHLLILSRNRISIRGFFIFSENPFQILGGVLALEVRVQLIGKVSWWSVQDGNLVCSLPFVWCQFSLLMFALEILIHVIVSLHFPNLFWLISYQFVWLLTLSLGIYLTIPHESCWWMIVWGYLDVGCYNKQVKMKVIKFLLVIQTTKLLMFFYSY